MGGVLVKRTDAMGLSLILIASFVTAAGSDDAQKDLDKMQGTWTVTAAQRDTTKESEKVLQAMQVVIKDDSLTIIEDKNAEHPDQEKGFLTLTPTTKPKSFDVALTGGAKSKLANGIYELTGDTLKMCCEGPVAHATYSLSHSSVPRGGTSLPCSRHHASA
jgi:uncharacterized protein (TIGR03067 family)